MANLKQLDNPSTFDDFSMKRWFEKLWKYFNGAIAIDTNNVVILPQGQLQFPITQVPSTDPSTLDDYEEGTWTPVYQGSVSNPSCTYSVITGNYVKIGGICHFWLNLTVSASAFTLGSGNLMIGLPFTATGLGMAHIPYAAGFTTLNPYAGIIFTGTASARIYEISSSTSFSRAVAQTSRLATNCDLYMSGSYPVA